VTQIKRLPGETKEEAKLRSQKAAQARIDADELATKEARRMLYTAWLFWKYCPHKRCRHHCACAGDVERCHDRFWPFVPEDVKVMFRAYLTAWAGDKLPQHEALRHAGAERARYLEMEARFARRKAEREAAEAQKLAPPQPRYVPEDRAPRVRML
jgi:hypothetical protein